MIIRDIDILIKRFIALFTSLTGLELIVTENVTFVKQIVIIL